MQNSVTIGIKRLLTASFIAMSTIYYLYLSTEQILEIIKKEYIILGLLVICAIVFVYYKVKLKNLTLISYIPNINNVDMKTTLGFFILFQIIDFYYENGFIGMISQWFMYWVFAVIAWLVTNNINFYKNYQFYKYESMSDKRL